MARYRFQFEWQSVYGHVVRLVERLAAKPGLVLDLGCGFGAVAEPLAELGLTYVGCDVDKEGLDDLRARGFEAHELDLSAYADLGERLTGIAAGRDVAAVLLLDVLEHIPRTADFLEALRDGVVRVGRPLLVTSVPNVAHYDLGAKLAFGRWDLTETGLLDSTHLQLFTADRLVREMAEAGWSQRGENDYLLLRSDQHFPADHPVIAPVTMLRRFLEAWRNRVDDAAWTYQFVRAFSLGSPPPAAPVRTQGPFLSVVMRTQGLREALLLEALTCLAAQTSDDFEVLLLAHTTDPGRIASVRDLVGRFAPTFAARVRVIDVADGQRSRPLNIGLERARGRYIAFLDDDDLVTAHWVESFMDGAAASPGSIVRSAAVHRSIQRLEEGRLAPYQVLNRGSVMDERPFDLMAHIQHNATPICSFAVPSEAVAAFRMRFDETLPVIEDYDFLMRLAQVCGVHDTGAITSVYNRWEGAESTIGSIPFTVWLQSYGLVLQRLDAEPLLLPPGSATRVRDLLDHTDARVARLGDELDEVRRDLAYTRERLAETQENLERYVKGLEESWDQVKQLQSSASWRLTRPVRAVTRLLRRPRG